MNISAKKDFKNAVDKMILDVQESGIEVHLNTVCTKEMLEEIRKELNFTSLKFHRLDDLKASIGISPCKLCTYCWDGKE